MVRPPLPLPALTGSGRRSRWRRRVLRRVLSAALVAVSLALVVRELRPPPPPTVGVVVAATPIPAGAVLTAAHLRTARVPVQGVQPGALTRVEEAAGRRVGSGLDAGETVTTRRLVPRGPADGLRPGRVALHVVASDPASVDLLAPGTWTRVYPVSGGAVISGAAEVLTVDPPVDEGGLLSAAPPVGRGVVLALDVHEADAVVAGHGSLDGPVVVTLVASAR